MTFDASRLTVFAMTAPQPSLKARLMTLRLVPGGPEPMTKGLGSFRPSTVVARVGMVKKKADAVRARRVDAVKAGVTSTSFQDTKAPAHHELSAESQAHHY